MLVPTPKLIDDFLRSIPGGEQVNVRAMRNTLARGHDTQVTCPIYTGYHPRTVAEAADEALGRLSFGAAFVHQKRREEGLPE